MARSVAQSRLNHLERSAYLLALRAPQTSAHLQAEYTRLLSEAGTGHSEARAREVCGSCGTIMLQGLTSSIRKGTGTLNSTSDEGKNVAARTSRSAPARRAHICKSCSAVTRYSVAQKTSDTLRSVKGLPGTASAKRESASTSSQSQRNVKPSQRRERNITSRNKSSKNRAKTRKMSGLQESLARSKSQSVNASQSVDFEMGLMDIVKKS